MESIIILLQAFHLNMLEVIITGFLLFSIGYWLGAKKAKKLTENIYELQRDVLELNAEILFGKPETPVIGIKQDSLKSSKLAR